MKLRIIYTYIAVFFLQCFGAQTLSSSLTKNKVGMGEPTVLKITINGLQGKDVVSAPKNELLPFHFEEIKDDIDKKKDQYTRLIEFAIFEEGTFKIPPLEFKIGGQVQTTIPYEIQVVNTAQQGDEVKDIMNNKQVELGVRDYWELYKYYVLGILGFLALVFLIVFFVKYGRKKSAEAKLPTNKTLKALELLKKKKYIQSGNYRSFYVELIEISRTFLQEQYHIPAEVLLTDDLLALMKEDSKISIENEKVIEDVFLRGDLVKFAKTIPDADLMETDYQKIVDFVKRSYQDIEFENLRKDV
ncbi:protein BatD [Riemerella anatipestifer]|uniref:BatD family protein n=1 Tax=Riemerella anatipestifer TaxID=34085 RepID=UPI001AD619CA|nr:BatD family protein [Riemerella anatipestifer]MBO4234406.1 protein BatD [Riemerella anatipestifer]